MQGSAATPLPPGIRVQRIVRMSRVVADVGRAADFYVRALCFERRYQGAVERDRLAALGVAQRRQEHAAVGDPAPETTLQETTAQEAVLVLGTDELGLVQFGTGHRPYPPGSRSNDLWFEHCAIVVSDIDAAYAHLRAQPDWHPVSTGGPQRLPPASGGVRAFKFRDPDGHPLELLWFPPGAGRPIWHERAAPLRCAGSGRGAAPFLGIDHSALAIRATRASLEFYRGLGFRVAARTFNRGSEQAALDGLSPAAARVRVVALRPAASTGPGLELLAYRPPGRERAYPPPAAPASLLDRVSGWVTLLNVGTVPDGQPAAGLAPARYLAQRDPDGHRFLVVSAAGTPPVTTVEANGWAAASESASGRAPSMTSPSPPTNPKFLRNSQKCSSPSPSWKRQKSAKRQN